MRQKLVVNGIPVHAAYRDEDVREVFLPLLRRWSARQKERGGRVIVLLAAPPGTGKTTLTYFLQHLSRTFERLVPVQAMGMDGFHFPNAYLDTHTYIEDGRSVLLRSRKGAPFTFDVRALQEALEDARGGRPRPWPSYSRISHDVEPASVPVTGDILLVEGNYLLLDEDGWRDLRNLADETVFLAADEAFLRQRLVGRKVAGGLSYEEAVAWYRASDGRNVEDVLGRRMPADIELLMTSGAPKHPDAVTFARH